MEIQFCMAARSDSTVESDLAATDRIGYKVLKVMLRFCLVDVRLLVAYSLPLPLSYPKKGSWRAQGRKQKPIRIRICEFVCSTNSLV